MKNVGIGRAKAAIVPNSRLYLVRMKRNPNIVLAASVQVNAIIAFVFEFAKPNFLSGPIVASGIDFLWPFFHDHRIFNTQIRWDDAMKGWSD